MKQIIAYDIGGTNSRIALFEDGKIIWRDELLTPGNLGLQAVIGTMQNLQQRLTSSMSNSPSNSLANFSLNPETPIGVAFAGQVVNGCVHTDPNGTLPGWENFPLAQQLSSVFSRPVQIINDARAAAWGEYQLTQGRGCGEFLFVTISTGVGAGLVLNGKLHLAKNGYDAELGETLMQDGRMLEQHASGTAMQQAALQFGYVNGKLLCDAADQGDPQAELIYRHGITQLARKIADMVVMLGIEKVVIGGGLGLRPRYLERLREELAKLPAKYQCELKLAELGHDAGLYGISALLSENAAQDNLRATETS